MEIFAKRLNQLIAEYRITRYRLAKDIGVNKQTVVFWCEGTNTPKINYLYDLAVYFDVSADYLIGLEDEQGNKIQLLH
jgi:transcriptional regulator with XRE-family HTH domain